MEVKILGDVADADLKSRVLRGSVDSSSSSFFGDVDLEVGALDELSNVTFDLAAV